MQRQPDPYRRVHVAVQSQPTELTTNTFIANGDVGGLANFLNTTASFTTTGNGGLLRNGGRVTREALDDGS